MPRHETATNTFEESIVVTRAGSDSVASPVRSCVGNPVTLVVGNDSPTEIIVDSQILRKVSPVFEKMLYGTFRESRPSSGDWRVDLTADDPTIMLILMRYVHRIAQPRILAHQIPPLLALTHKYDMTHAIISLASNLTKTWGELETEKLSEHLFITFELCRKSAFIAAAIDVIENLWEDPDSKQWFIRKQAVTLNKSMPYISEIRDLISGARAKAATKIIRFCQSVGAQFLQIRACACKGPGASSAERRQCHVLQLGHLVAAASQEKVLNLFMAFNNSEFPVSIFTVRQSLRRVQIAMANAILPSASSNNARHYGCLIPRKQWDEFWKDCDNVIRTLTNDFVSRTMQRHTIQELFFDVEEV